MFKHEMPTDQATLDKLGLRDIPRWYRDKYGMKSSNTNNVPDTPTHIRPEVTRSWRPGQNAPLGFPNPRGDASSRYLLTNLPGEHIGSMTGMPYTSGQPRLNYLSRQGPYQSQCEVRNGLATPGSPQTPEKFVNVADMKPFGLGIRDNSQHLKRIDLLTQDLPANRSVTEPSSLLANQRSARDLGPIGKNRPQDPTGLNATTSQYSRPMSTGYYGLESTQNATQQRLAYDQARYPPAPISRPTSSSAWTLYDNRYGNYCAGLDSNSFMSTDETYQQEDPTKKKQRHGKLFQPHTSSPYAMNPSSFSVGRPLRGTDGTFDGYDSMCESPIISSTNPTREGLTNISKGPSGITSMSQSFPPSPNRPFSVHSGFSAPISNAYSKPKYSKSKSKAKKAEGRGEKGAHRDMKQNLEVDLFELGLDDKVEPSDKRT